MNKIRFGHSEYSIMIWLVSVFPLIILLFIPPPFPWGFSGAFDSYRWFIVILIVFSIVIGVFAICWMPYLVGKYRLRPQIDRCKEGETCWNRVTKDRIIVSQFVDKGPYGQNKGVTYKEKADIIDDGSFACKYLNGNSVVIMYDLMNVNADLNKSVARKQMMKDHGIRSGVEGYKKAKDEGMVK